MYSQKVYAGASMVRTPWPKLARGFPAPPEQSSTWRQPSPGARSRLRYAGRSTASGKVAAATARSTGSCPRGSGAPAEASAPDEKATAVKAKRAAREAGTGRFGTVAGRVTDGAIVGSAVVKKITQIMESGAGTEEIARGVGDYCRGLLTKVR